MSTPTAAELGELQVVAPFWLDQPAEEVLEIAVQARRNGFGAMWLGEMATFDAFALATALAARTDRIGITVGPLAVGVRDPVALALGIASVAALGGRRETLMGLAGLGECPVSPSNETILGSQTGTRSLFVGAFRSRRGHGLDGSEKFSGPQ